MKQIIGYMEYDYTNVKYGMWYMILIFGIASTGFSIRSGMGSIGYMLFGGLILASTAFNVTKQTVSFTALVPGSILQKVLGRYLGSIICILLCAVFGIISAFAMKIAGFDNGEIETSVLLGLIGVTLFFLAFQNVFLYLLTPLLGMQLASLIRMVPGFILFFVVMNNGVIEDLDMIPEVLQYGNLPGLMLIGIGVISLGIAVFLSCLIIRNRDNE